MTNHKHLWICAYIGISILGCGHSDNDSQPNTSMPVETQPIIAEPFPVEIPEPIPTPECNRDLAGTCFNNPPTMGALQA